MVDGRSALVLASAALIGCNAVLGIGEPVRPSDDDGNGGTVGVVANGSVPGAGGASAGAGGTDPAGGGTGSAGSGVIGGAITSGLDADVCGNEGQPCCNGDTPCAATLGCNAGTNACVRCALFVELGAGSPNFNAISDDGELVSVSIDRGGALNALRWSVSGETIDLGAQPSAPNGFAPQDMSADGRVIAGNAGGRAYRWQEDAGFIDLGDLTDGTGTYSVLGVSADGRAVMGMCAQAGGCTPAATTVYRGFRWTVSDGSALLDLGDPPNAMGNGAVPWAIDASGGTIVGYYGASAFRWTNTGMIDLGKLEDAFTMATRVNANGTVVVGYSGTRAFRWTPGTGMIDLGSLDGAPSDASYGAQAVSEDGAVVIGVAGGTDYARVFRWTMETGMVDLGIPAGSPNTTRLGLWNTLVTGVDARGALVAGQYYPSPGSNDHRSFRWTLASGMRDLADDQPPGLVPDGWVLESAHAVSGDGSLIAGAGKNPQGLEEGWLLRAGQSCSAP